MQKVLDTVLLLALPASGKSELRRFLGLQSEEVCREYFHMGPTVQLDDYPYVHFMRRIDEILEESDQERLFFEAGDKGFKDSRDWGTLIALINEDYEDLLALRSRTRDGYSKILLDRMDGARTTVGGSTLKAVLKGEVLDKVAVQLTEEVDDFVKEWNENLPDTLDGKTIVIEFARGGPDGASFPLGDHHGYQYSLSILSKKILSHASVLYVWVTPEQSRAKNNERARPGADGSILFHGVPMHVMMNDYGCDDMEYLLTSSPEEGCVPVEFDAEKILLKTSRLDNRDDLTTFVREEEKDWSKEDSTKLRDAISGALNKLWNMGAPTR